MLERAALLDANARRMLVSCHLRRGARGAAREVLATAAQAHLEDPAVRDELAEVVLEDGRVDDALLLLEEADELCPTPRRALRRASMYLQLRLERRAAQVLRRAAQRAPHDAELAAALRETDALLGRDPLSAALSEAAVANATGRVAQAREHLRAGEVDKAKRALALAHPEDQGYRELRAALRPSSIPAAGAGQPGAVAQPGQIGVLGWGPRGGSVSPLQALAVPGHGNLFVTGNVGETGVEAARVAWSCLKARSAELALTAEVARHDLHLHFADTEISKEGASSGLALVLAGISALRKEPLPADLAATGEITLAGELKPVAGIHEKLVAATLAGVTRVLMPRRNLREARELPRLVPARVNLTFVDTISEAAQAVRGGP
ncbi:MAG: magnesium chelatase domain-containing protein [Myxococcales bacterium]